ncbi:MAG TPA: DUF971 domain-containing protein [Chloroflexota bacterium]|jgi:DUF971 family protein|nr:DUF971 domain-containing protein [Chloroflexota bacterium]
MADPFEGIAPVSIAGDADNRRMAVTWNDGHESVLDYAWLRWHCPCATCSGEGSVPGTLASTTALTDEQTTLDDLQLVGSYGMSPVWGDGHHTGIFTFRALRAMCPCADCTAKREALLRDEARRQR